MFKKKIQMIFLAVLGILALSVTASALKNESGETYNISDAAGGQLASSAVSENAYEIYLSGDTAVSTNPIYIEKLFSFDIVLNGENYPAIMWLIKSVDNASAQVVLTDLNGIKANENYCSAIQSSTYNVENTEQIEIVFGENGCTVNDYLIISKAGEIENFSASSIISENNHVSQPVVNEQENLSNENDTENEVMPNKSEDTNEVNEEKGDNLFGKKFVIAIIVSLIGGVLLALFVYKIIKLKANTTEQIKAPRNVRENKVNQQETINNRGKKISATKKTVQTNNVRIEIPTGEAKPIIELCELKKAENTHKESSARDSIMKIYTGEIPTERFNGKVSFLSLSNVYDLNLSENQKPSFTVIQDRNNANYIMINEKYLFINFNKYNGKNFKFYSDISYANRCFDIESRNGDKTPRAQTILKLEPAVLKISGNTIILSEKGKMIIDS